MMASLYHSSSSASGGRGDRSLLHTEAEVLEDAAGDRNPDVGPDESFLETLPRLGVGRVEEEILCERLAAARERLAQAAEPPPAAVAFVLLGLGVVAEKLRPARHAESACRLSRSPASLFDTIWETPSAPIVTP